MWFLRRKAVLSNAVVCNECGVLVSTEKAVEVSEWNSVHFPIKTLFYCQAHAPKYAAYHCEYKFNGNNSRIENGIFYYKTFEVDKEGVPIGFIVKPDKKK